jgi:hypothetical protein
MIKAYDAEGAQTLNTVLCALATKWPKAVSPVHSRGGAARGGMSRERQVNFAMIWFVIGAVIGCFIGFVGLLRKGPGYANYPIQGFIFSAVLGAIVVGIPLWILSRIF